MAFRPLEPESPRYENLLAALRSNPIKGLHDIKEASNGNVYCVLLDTNSVDVMDDLLRQHHYAPEYPVYFKNAYAVRAFPLNS